MNRIPIRTRTSQVLAHFGKQTKRAASKYCETPRAGAIKCLLILMRLQSEMIFCSIMDGGVEKWVLKPGLWEIKGPRCSVDTHTYTHNERMLYVIHILLERDWETESRRRREVEIQWLYLLRLLYTPSNVLFNALWFWFLFNLKCLQEPFVVTDWAQITSDTRNYDAMPVAWCNRQSWQITLLGEGRAFFLVDHNDHCHCFLLLKSEDFCFISLSTEYLRVFDCSVKRSPAALEGHFSLFSQFVLDLNWKNDRQIHQ